MKKVLYVEKLVPILSPPSHGRIYVNQLMLSFDAVFSSLPLADSPPRDLHITAYT